MKKKETGMNERAAFAAAFKAKTGFDLAFTLDALRHFKRSNIKRTNGRNGQNGNSADS